MSDIVTEDYHCGLSSRSVGTAAASISLTALCKAVLVYKGQRIIIHEPEILRHAMSLWSKLPP